MGNKYDDMMARFEGRMKQPATTATQISDVEARLGYPLPEDYREFLEGYGGDYLFYSSVVYPVQLEDYVGFKTIFVFYGASSAETDVAERYRSALDSDTPISMYLGMGRVNGRQFDAEEEEWGWPTELMSIGCDEGGNQICLALFGLRPGAIFFWVNAPSDGYQNVYLVADSFDEFMQLLQLD